MATNYVSHSHSYGESALHLQFTPKYRRKVFTDRVLKEACKGFFFLAAVQLGVKLVAVEFGPDHCHLFIRNWKRYPIPHLAQMFKGRTSYEIRRRFPDHLAPYGLHTASSFWSDGYFYETVGSVTAEARQYYIERCQDKHWDDPSLWEMPDSLQSQLTNFTNG